MVLSSSHRKVTRCSVEDCPKKAQSRRLCKGHGGGVRCHAPSCQKLAQNRGLCVAHGGGRHCAVENCGKLSQYRGLCQAHGGGRRCSVPDCQKFRQIRDLCKLHAKLQMKTGAAKSSSAPDHLFAAEPTCTTYKLSISFLMNPLGSGSIARNFQSAPTPATPAEYAATRMFPANVDELVFAMSNYNQNFLTPI